MNKLVVALLIIFSYKSTATQSPSSTEHSSVELAVRSIALEFCACKNLMNRDLSFCSDYVFEGIPLPKFLFRIVHNDKTKSISVASRLTLGFVKSEVSYRNGTCLYP
jgi:hypothetical protein